MPDTCRVVFQPEDKSAAVKTGTTILDAAAQAGVSIDGLCGGDGVCGRCRVIVRDGQVAGGTTNHLTREDILAGYILACEGRVESDLIVEVPAETGLTETPHVIAGEVPELVDVAGQLGRRLPLTPLVTKTYLALPPPSLDDNVSDLQRLEQALARAIPSDGFQMGLKATRLLPETLRRSDWKVTATTGFRGPLTEI
ncbi:MAG: 2Fe-2S iron-sulfur cluster-binding protein, partial [Pirellulales bacterium]